MFDLDRITRNNIKQLSPYSSARSEYTGEASIFLDANENPFNTPFNRYPDPLQREVKKAIAKVKKVDVDQIFLGNGSDEPIDLIIRAFCEPGQDNIVAMEPTYGMYSVAAAINNVAYRKVLLSEDFVLDGQKILDAVDDRTKLIFLCSPNNPTGNTIPEETLERILKQFSGLVIIDEAYIDFSSNPSFTKRLGTTPNLIVLQTFSKAWGMAGIRLGMAFAQVPIIQILTKIKYPYNINVLTQRTVLSALQNETQVQEWIKALLSERVRLAEMLRTVPCIHKIFPSDANFILVKTDDPQAIYRYLVNQRIIVRNRNSVSLCAGCLRLTVGIKEENDALIEALLEYSKTH